MELSTRLRRRQLVELHLKPEHLIAIGNVAVRSAVLDLMIEITEEYMSKNFPEFRAGRTANLSTPQKLDIIKKALTKQLPQHKHAIAECIRDVNRARDERAEIIHRVWERTDSEEVKVLIDPRHWMKRKPLRRVTSESMMTLATSMIDLAFELSDWKMISSQILMGQPALVRGERQQRRPIPSPPRTSKMDGT
jgi:hypothetical protein